MQQIIAKILSICITVPVHEGSHVYLHKIIDRHRVDFYGSCISPSIFIFQLHNSIEQKKNGLDADVTDRRVLQIRRPVLLCKELPESCCYQHVQEYRLILTFR